MSPKKNKTIIEMNRLKNRLMVNDLRLIVIMLGRFRGRIFSSDSMLSQSKSPRNESAIIRVVKKSNVSLEESKVAGGGGGTGAVGATTKPINDR